MTPQRLTQYRTASGGRRLVLACPCLRLTRDLAGWEAPAPAIAELRAEHARQVPGCPHPFPSTTFEPHGEAPTLFEARP